MGLDRVPTLDEINEDPQFEAAEITADEFEEIWAKVKEWFELP